MLNPQTITEREERDARDKTFYLVKKYTSYTFLDHARKQYQAFLNAFARQLNDPGLIKPEPVDQRWFEANMADGTYEGDYREFLKNMAPLEEGLELLYTTPHKEEAYRTILNSRFADGLWGRGALERSLDYDPFYLELGIVHINESDGTISVKFDKEILEVAVGNDYLCATKRSVFEFDWWLSDGKRVTYHWSYESFFNSYDSTGGVWPPIAYPPTLPSCPSKNVSPEGQIWSGEEIPTTGIWEPWFAEESLLGGIVSRLAGKQPATLTGKVGCPNYFLAGATAFEYEMEGADKTKKVAWRLLWEDTRYLDGTIPEEEAGYFAAPAAAASPALAVSTVLTARPGEPCPESGEWYSVNWGGQRMMLQKGEPMPGPEFSSSGAVIWHMKKEAS